GRLSEADAQNRMALRINPNGRLPVLLEIGEIALLQGRLEEAERNFTQAEEVQTSDSSYLQRIYGGLGAAAVHRKNWQQASEFWSQGAGEVIAATRSSRVLSMQVLAAAESKSYVDDGILFYGFLRSAYLAAQQDQSLRKVMSSRAFELAQ